MERLISWVVNRDNRILSYVNEQFRSPFLDCWMSRITHLRGATFTVCLLLFFTIASNFKSRIGVEGLIALGTSHLLVQVLKRNLSRKRPYHDEGLRIFVKQLKDYSFPSGHTTAIFSLTTTLSLFLPWLASLLLPIAFLVGFSRIYLGHHYPTDVAMGAVIGVTFSIGTHILFV